MQPRNYHLAQFQVLRPDLMHCSTNHIGKSKFNKHCCVLSNSGLSNATSNGQNS